MDPQTKEQKLKLGEQKAADAQAKLISATQKMSSARVLNEREAAQRAAGNVAAADVTKEQMNLLIEQGEAEIAEATALAQESAALLLEVKNG